MLIRTVRACVGEVLGTEIRDDQPLMAAGVDSLGATELERALSKHFEVELPATLLFDHPSIDGIVCLVSAFSKVPCQTA